MEESGEPRAIGRRIKARMNGLRQAQEEIDGDLLAALASRATIPATARRSPPHELSHLRNDVAVLCIVCGDPCDRARANSLSTPHETVMFCSIECLRAYVHPLPHHPLSPDETPPEAVVTRPRGEEHPNGFSEETGEGNGQTARRSDNGAGAGTAR